MSFEKDQKLIAELKGLVLDATRKANSGHPGGAMSSADFAVILFKDYLKYSPQFPDWYNRDRFVLSAGHESMLIYSLLYFMGLLSLDEIKNFRQFGSLTPGHPESHLTRGVEATTGPLGQGFSMAVGMAMAEANLRAELGEKVDHNTYVLCGDGDMQEPVALGSASIAGHFKLNRLVAYYDKNDIQISGKTSRADSTDYKTLFESFGWEVKEIDGHDHNTIRQTLDYSNTSRQKPLLIIGYTTIAKGSFSLEGSHKTHGEPMKPEEIASTKQKLGLNPGAFFQTSEESKEHFSSRLQSFNSIAEVDEKYFNNAVEELGSSWEKRFKANLDESKYPKFDPETTLATRKAFGSVLKIFAEELPALMGGSADLEPSNNTGVLGEVGGEFNAENYAGKNIAFGVREFPMAAICNGMALHGGVLPFSASFLTFSDYSRNAIRMSAIQKLQVLHVYTHDSIFLGEDGPTHQPVEHITSLRLIPNLLVFRPADAWETLASMKHFLSEKNRPSLLALTRQALPILSPEEYGEVQLSKGAYLKYQSMPGSETCTVVYASGSEVHLAIEAAKKISSDLTLNQNIKVFSVPCFKLFFEQSESYQASVLCENVKIRMSIEAGTTLGWQRFTGLQGINIGIDRFGESAPFNDLVEHFGFTVKAVADLLKEALTA